MEKTSTQFNIGLDATTKKSNPNANYEDHLKCLPKSPNHFLITTSKIQKPNSKKNPETPLDSNSQELKRNQKRAI